MDSADKPRNVGVVWVGEQLSTDPRNQHFSGEVAKALQTNAKHLIEGGWEQGVVANVHNFDVIAVS